MKQEEWEEEIYQNKIYKMMSDYGYKKDGGETVKTTVSKKELQNLVRVARLLNDEGGLQIAKNSIKYVAVDPTHVQLATYEISAEGTRANKKDKDIGIDFQDLWKALLHIDGSKIEIEKVQGLYPIPTWVIKGKTMTRYMSVILKPYIPKVPELEYTHVFVANTAEIKRALRLLRDVSDYFTIESMPGGVVTLSASYENDEKKQYDEAEVSLNVEWKQGEEGEKFKSMYPIGGYIDDVVKTISDKTITISIATDWPITIQHSHGRFMAAPRIDPQ